MRRLRGSGVRGPRTFGVFRVRGTKERYICNMVTLSVPAPFSRRPVSTRLARRFAPSARWAAPWRGARARSRRAGTEMQDSLYERQRLRYADKKMVLAAVFQDGMALEYAAEELRADREVVLAAVSENGLAVNFAAKELRADREVVMAVVENGITMSSLLLLEPTPYVQQVLGWGQFFCKETSSFEELHARFCGAPVEIGDPFLEGFPDLGWRFRAEMEGMKSDDEHAADGSLVQVASQEEQDNPAKREQIDELSQEIHAPRDQAEKENRRQEDAGLTQPPRKRRR